MLEQRYLKPCLLTILISLDHCGLLDNLPPFGEINIILNQDIIHHFQDTYGKIVLVKCGYYISQAQKYFTI